MEQMSNENKATENTFWGLLSQDNSNFSIFIPRIQRDYAQGREEIEANQIREIFVNDIFNALDKNETLDVNFIYGNIDNTDNKNRFIPIDGQQRLTTLFLLHWYFARYSGKIDSDNSVKDTLLKFQYETRYVTGQFCERLCKDVKVNLKEKIKNNDKELAKTIKDNYWFFSEFENNATVSAMLVMLDAIHAKAFEYPEEKLDTFFDKLTSADAPIKFLYLDLDDFGLNNNIYIKMNARGKPLTHFENFKAQLNNYLNKDKDFADTFIEKINSDWSYFFWTKDYRPEKKENGKPTGKKEIVFDTQMMKLFRFCIMMDYISNITQEDFQNSNTDARVILAILNKERDYEFTSRLFKDGFKSVYPLITEKENVNEQTFRKIFVLLNVLAKKQKEDKNLNFLEPSLFNGKQFINETEAFKRIIRATDEKELTSEESVIIFAEYAFLIKYANEDYSFTKTKELTNWIRVVYNLIQSTLNLQLDVFYRMIYTINSIINSGKCDDILSFLATLVTWNNDKDGVLAAFFDDQVREESIKAILMKSSDTWKQKIIEAENSFLDGQIGSILDFAGITKQYEQDIFAIVGEDKEKRDIPETSKVLNKATDDSDFFNKFNEYLNKFNMFFDISGLKEEFESDSIFRRALLTFGNDSSYMLVKSSVLFSFLDNKSRDFGFKRLLRDDNNGKRLYLKELFDNIDLNKDLKQQLETIISNVKYTADNTWKKYFIEMPEILESTSKNKELKEEEIVFKNQQRVICMRDKNDILLVTKNTTGSIHREYYSYVFYLKAKAAGLNVQYVPNYLESIDKFATYENKDKAKEKVIFSKKTGKYEVLDINNSSIWTGDLESLLTRTKEVMKK